MATHVHKKANVVWLPSFIRRIQKRGRNYSQLEACAAYELYHVQRSRDYLLANERNANSPMTRRGKATSAINNRFARLRNDAGRQGEKAKIERSRYNLTTSTIRERATLLTSRSQRAKSMTSYSTYADGIESQNALKMQELAWDQEKSNPERWNKYKKNPSKCEKTRPSATSNATCSDICAQEALPHLEAHKGWG